MTTAVLAVAAGLLVGRATGGRTARVVEHPLLSWPWLAVGAAAQVLAHVDGLARVAFPLVLLSYAALTMFAVRNLHLVGMGLVLAGIVMNASVITVNHGMPVRPSAAAAVGVDDLGAVHHRERPSDRLTALGDVVPAGPLGEVLSIGDLVLAAGLANVAGRMLRPRPSRSAYRPRRRSVGDLGPVTSQ